MPLAMTIESSAFTHNGAIPPQFTCDGEGISPPLRIRGTPQSAKALVLIMDDPDAPGKTFDHWMVWNIPPGTQEIVQGAVPQGIVGKNSSNKNAYFPPCPPGGQHRYFFKVYALDTQLDLPTFSSKKDVTRAMEDHILDSAEMVGLYQRK